MTRVMTGSEVMSEWTTAENFTLKGTVHTKLEVLSLCCFHSSLSRILYTNDDCISIFMDSMLEITGEKNFRSQEQMESLLQYITVQKFGVSKIFLLKKIIFSLRMH